MQAYIRSSAQQIQNAGFQIISISATTKKTTFRNPSTQSNAIYQLNRTNDIY